MLCMAGCHAQPSGAPLQYTCVAGKSEIVISADAEAAPSGTRLAWSHLIRLGPQKNNQGDLLRTGSKTLARTCGALSVRFKGGYLNSNVMGQDGAVEFAVVEIRHGKKKLLPATAMAECDMNDDRMNYFGACPNRWAVSIHTHTIASGRWEISVVRQFLDNATTVRKVSETIH